MSIWGKVVGGFAGLAMGGPLGAVLGAVAGHAYDTMKSEKLERAGGSEERQIAFTTAVIVLSAKMAKADGHVAREEVKAFKEAFSIPPSEIAGVGRIFDEAKTNAEGYEPYAQQIANMFANERPILEELLGALFHIAKADGKIHQKEVEFCQNVSQFFGLTRAEFERLQAIHISNPGGGSPGENLHLAYSILGVPTDASDDEVRAAYRKLAREYHPDRLIAEGLPQEFVDLAHEKIVAINDAYDQVQKERGIS